MIKSTKYFIVALILIIATSVSLMYLKDGATTSGIQKVYLLKGQGQNWSVDNLKVIIGDNSIKAGYGKVQIVDNSINTKEMTFYEIIVEKIARDDASKSKTLSLKSVSSSLSEGLNSRNYNSGEFTAYGKYDLSDYDLENKYDVYATVKHRIKNGKVEEEQFKLDVVTSISEQNNEIIVTENEI